MVQKLPIPACTAARSRTFLALAIGGLVLTLGGCTQERKIEELDKRMAAVEAKADAATKRARAAEDYVKHPDPGAVAEVDPQSDADSGVDISADPAGEDPGAGTDIVPDSPPDPPGNA